MLWRICGRRGIVMVSLSKPNIDQRVAFQHTGAAVMMYAYPKPVDSRPSPDQNVVLFPRIGRGSFAADI
jgi:hypothetical protein